MKIITKYYDKQGKLRILKNKKVDSTIRFKIVNYCGLKPAAYEIKTQ